MKYKTLITTSALISSSISVLNAESHRNFLFILVDDYGSKDSGVGGSIFYETPNIDSLAKSGMRFTHAYSACQVCSPSRAAIISGQYPPRIGITDWIGSPSGIKWKRNDIVMPADYEHALKKDAVTLAEALHNAGYKTFFAGKWHLGGAGSLPTDHGFDINIGGYHRGSPPGGYFSPYKNPYLSDGPMGEKLPERLASETIKFIEASKNNKFFAYLSFYAVHGRIQTTKKLWRKYRDKALKMGLDKIKPQFIFDRRLPVRQVQDNPVYAGLIEMMDDAVGMVLDKLKELGLDKNTVVCFTGDNGSVTSGDCYSTSVLPFRGGKGRQWEGGLRVPLFIRVPGMTKPDSICTTPVIGIDFYPTILQLAGVKLPENYKIDGVSLVPLLQNKKIPKRSLFWHYPHYGNQGGEPSSIILSGDMKLIHYWEDGRDELYNIADDIGEKHNIASKHPETLKNMRRQLDSWLNNLNAKIPEKDQRYNPQKKNKQLLNLETEKTRVMCKNAIKALAPEEKPPKGVYIDE